MRCPSQQLPRVPPRPRLGRAELGSRQSLPRPRLVEPAARRPRRPPRLDRLSLHRRGLRQRRRRLRRQTTPPEPPSAPAGASPPGDLDRPRPRNLGVPVAICASPGSWSRPQRVRQSGAAPPRRRSDQAGPDVSSRIAGHRRMPPAAGADSTASSTSAATSRPRHSCRSSSPPRADGRRAAAGNSFEGGGVHADGAQPGASKRVGNARLRALISP